MSTSIDADQTPRLTRRAFMLGAAGLGFAVLAPGCATQHSATHLGATLAPNTGDAKLVNAYVSLATDGTVYIQSPATEMGQGSLTSLPLIVADEMDAAWDKVRIVPAPPSDAVYGNPGFGGIQYTAGSTAVFGYFEHLRKFGAQVRLALLDNAARHWNVPVAELTTEPNVVVHAKTGRRIGYGEIAAFMTVPTTAPDIKPEQLKKATDFRLIGKKDVMRVDVPSKVDGSAQYSLDVQLPGMLYGVIQRTPVEGAKPIKIDDGAARALQGVVRIVPLPFGVGVIAEKPWIAVQAREALRITWDRSAKGWGFDSEKGLEDYARQARDLQIAGKPWGRAGDPVAAMKGAARVVEQEYRCDYAYHGQLEPLNVVVSVTPAGDACEIWAGTQSQTMAVTAAANALGISADKVKLNAMLMGGGFGRRGNRDVEFIVDGVLLAREVRRPVKCIWTREDDFKNGRFRPMSAHFMRAGLDASGRIIAWQHRLACDQVMPFMDPQRYEKAKRNDVIAILGSELRTYDVPDRTAEHLSQDNGMRTAPLRAIGVGNNVFATECFLDEVAAQRGVDPVELRLQLLHKVPRARRVIEEVVAMSEYRRARPGRGLGLAYLNYSGTETAGVVEISVDRARGDIRLHNFWAAIDCGIAVQPDNVAAQSESSLVYGIGLAVSERITIKDGVVQQSNFYDYKVPRMLDVPQMHVKVIQTDNAPTGAGQMTTPLAAPAIAAAFYASTGKRIRHIPFIPDRVLAALRA